jgi:hypothetical protein
MLTACTRGCVTLRMQWEGKKSQANEWQDEVNNDALY